MNFVNHSFERSLSLFSTEDILVKKGKQGDRFIPQRAREEVDMNNYDTPTKEKPNPNSKHLNEARNLKSIPVFSSESPESSNKKKYSKILKKNILRRDQNRKGSVLSFTSESRKGSLYNKDTHDLCKIISAFEMDFNFLENLAPRSRPLPKKPYKILDSPEMEDDFYKQLLHWSPTNNMVAIGLSNSVYIWDAQKKKANLLCEFFEYEELCSLRWDQDGKFFAFGMGSGEIKIWDFKKNQSVQSLSGHTSRVGAIDWSDCIFSGSKDKTVQMIDRREGDSPTKEFLGHSKQVLNVRKSPNNHPYILSGGNDNKALVYDIRKEKNYLFKATHEGPVRAIDWSSRRKGVFATGGGSSDMIVKLWNLNHQKKIDEVMTGAQVCDVKFSPLEKEIVVSLGGEANTVEFFKEKNLQKVGSLRGHSARVLNIDFSPDMTDLVSISPDETMRFWEVNDLIRQRSKTQQSEPPKFKGMFGMR